MYAIIQKAPLEQQNKQNNDVDNISNDGSEVDIVNYSDESDNEDEGSNNILSPTVCNVNTTVADGTIVFTGVDAHVDAYDSLCDDENQMQESQYASNVGNDRETYSGNQSEAGDLHENDSEGEQDIVVTQFLKRKKIKKEKMEPENKRKRVEINYSYFFESDDELSRSESVESEYEQSAESEHENEVGAEGVMANNVNASTKSFVQESSDKSSDIDMQSQNGVFKCTICDGKFTNKSTFIRHSHSHRSFNRLSTPAMGSVACSLCKMSFKSKNELHQHSLKHRPRKYSCPDCKRRFQSKTRFQSHKCLGKPVSPNKPVKRSETRKHPRIGYVSGTFTCSWCKRVCRSMQSLQVHERRHTGDKPYKCDSCDMAFVSITEQKAHQRIHTGERPYKCEFCPKSFRTSSDFARHRRSHLGEKPHICTFCPKDFVSASEKKSHEKNIHFDELVKRGTAMGHRIGVSLVCNICGQRCKGISALRTHR